MSKIKILGKEFEAGDMVEVELKKFNCKSQIGYVAYKMKEKKWSATGVDYIEKISLARDYNKRTGETWGGLLIIESDIKSINKLVYEPN